MTRHIVVLVGVVAVVGLSACGGGMETLGQADPSAQAGQTGQAVVRGNGPAHVCVSDAYVFWSTSLQRYSNVRGGTALNVVGWNWCAGGHWFPHVRGSGYDGWTNPYNLCPGY